MVTMKDIINLKRKIGRCRNKKTLERYGLQLDQWIVELQNSIDRNQDILESLQPKGYFRHSYSYDQFENGLLQRRGHRKYLRG